MVRTSNPGGVSAAEGRDAGMEWTVETRSCVCACECGEAEGSGRHRAGSSWGIQQRQACLRDRMPSPTGRLPPGGESPSLLGKPPPLLSTSLLISPSSSNSRRAGPATKSMTLQSPFKFK